MTLKNLQPGSVSSDFTVDFYYSDTYAATTPAFSPVPAALLQSVTVHGIGGSTSVPVNATITIPSLSSSEVIYVYAVVDQADVTGDADTSNNMSSATNAAAMFAYQSTATQYSIYIRSYAPTSGDSLNVGMALYKLDEPIASPATATRVDSAFPYGENYLALPESTLAPGTYYVAVVSMGGDSGPYAFNTYTNDSNTQLSFTDLASDPNSSGDNNPTFSTASPPATLTLPVDFSPVQRSIGTPVNWYMRSGDFDWFTFTLPAP